MDRQQVTTMANKFQSVLDADVLNERGKQLGFAKRKRLITPFRLGLSLMASMATQQVRTIADLHRQFNELWQMETDYNAFHKQLDKSTAPVFFLASLSNIMSQLTMKGLGFEAGKAFRRGLRGHIFKLQSVGNIEHAPPIFHSCSVSITACFYDSFLYNEGLHHASAARSR